MKNFILSMGQLVLNVSVILGFVGAVISSLPYFSHNQLILGVLTIIGISIGVIIASFLAYLIIDIRDKLAENNQLLKNKV